VSETGLPAHQPLYAQTYQKSNGNINETDPSLQQNNWQESVHEDSRHQHSSFFHCGQRKTANKLEQLRPMA